MLNFAPRAHTKGATSCQPRIRKPTVYFQAFCPPKWIISECNCGFFNLGSTCSKSSATLLRHGRAKKIEWQGSANLEPVVKPPESDDDRWGKHFQASGKNQGTTKFHEFQSHVIWLLCMKWSLYKWCDRRSQVGVSSFEKTFHAPPRPAPPPPSLLPSIASSRSQWALPDPNCELEMSWALPDLHR